MQFNEHVPLAPYTTFGIGGPARWFAEAAAESEILDAVVFAEERKLPLFVLGGGSNLLVSDEGFPGLVLHVKLRGIAHHGAGLFAAAAGEDWDGFVSQTTVENCAGVECLAGIPGSVGGTPVQNVGAYGQEVAQTIKLVRALDLRTKMFVDLPPSACEFAYRRSIFNGSKRGTYIVSSVTYQLKINSESTTSYIDLKRYFQEWNSLPSVSEVAAAVREIRRSKGMLLVENDPDCASAGSFFKNPIVSKEVFQRIVAEAGGVPVPHYDAGPGFLKIPAAWLLEQSGFRKGYALGRAGISSRHTLALINRGGATAADVVTLRDKIISGVASRYGINLEPEPVWIG